jgi:hypothetical protein
MLSAGGEKALDAVRLHLLRQPPPTLAERLLGRRRARVMRHRIGFAAVGVGLALLRPKPRVRVTRSLVVLSAVAVAMAVTALGLPIR